MTETLLWLAGACLVTGLVAAFGLVRHRLFLAAYIIALALFIVAVADHMLNAAALALPLLVTFGVLFLLEVAAWVATRRGAPAPASAPADPARPPAKQAVTARKAPPARAAATAPARRAPKPYYDYRGDVHDVIDVEGIGPVYAERLQNAGVYTTARLCYEDAGRLAKRIGVPRKTVQGWQAMAELAKVNGIGKQYAEALTRGGVRGIEELKKQDAAAVAARVNEYLSTLDVNVLGQSVTPKRVSGWKRAARPMRRVRQPVPEA